MDNDTLRVKPFKLEPTTRFWVNTVVYGFEKGEIFVVAGGLYDEKSAEHLRKYLKTKKLL